MICFNDTPYIPPSVFFGHIFQFDKNSHRRKAFLFLQIQDFGVSPTGKCEGGIKYKCSFIHHHSCLINLKCSCEKSYNHINPNQLLRSALIDAHICRLTGYICCLYVEYIWMHLCWLFRGVIIHFNSDLNKQGIICSNFSFLNLRLLFHIKLIQREHY